MTQETKTILVKRLKSLAWRLGCYVAVAILAFLGKNLELFALPNEVVAIIAFVLGEATKFINNHTEIFGAKLK